MDSGVLAALISALASIAVAVLQRPRSKTSGKPKDPSPAAALRIPERNLKVWKGAGAILLAWLLATPFVNQDLAGFSLFLIPLLLLILSISVPIQPSIPPIAALVLFPLAFLAEPFNKWLNGMRAENHFDPDVLVAMLSVAFGTALVVWLLDRWRVSAYRSSVPAEKSRVVARSLTEELTELAELHRSGGLSDEEFARAKDKLLSA
jgi:hypothetical protein